MLLCLSFAILVAIWTNLLFSSISIAQNKPYTFYNLDPLCVIFVQKILKVYCVFDMWGVIIYYIIISHTKPL